MPLTFPAHAVAVLPLKLAWPRRLDRVALVVGSAAPDLPFAFFPYLRIEAHTLPALFWFCLPVTMAASRLIRQAAPIVAAHVPGLRDYGVLATVRYRWWVTAGCAVLAAASHLLWDSFIHPSAVTTWPALHLDHRVLGLPGYAFLQRACSLAGLLIAAALAWWVARRRSLPRWHGDLPEVRYDPAAFWLAAVPLLAVLPFLAGSQHYWTLYVRLLYVTALALLAAAAAVRVRQRLLSVDHT